MSLSTDPAFSYLKDNFVCGYADIKHKWYCGKSGKHEVDGVAIDTSNGAGPHNIQMFMLSGDGTVLHCLPGYWNSQDLYLELQLAAELNKVWLDPNLSVTQKDKIFVQKQLNHIFEHPMSMIRRSRMQGFDRKAELKKNYMPDTVSNPALFMADKQGRLAKFMQQNRFKGDGFTNVAFNTDSNDNSSFRLPRLNPVALYRQKQQQVDPEFKTVDELVHERIASNPFVPFSKFDTGSFVSYGTEHYDKSENKMDDNGNKTKGMTAKGVLGSAFRGIVNQTPLGQVYNLYEIGSGNNHFVPSESK